MPRFRGMSVFPARGTGEPVPRVCVPGMALMLEVQVLCEP